MKIKEIPVIFITGCCRDDIIEKTKDIKPLRYLLKPFKNEDLYTAIKGVLGNGNAGLTCVT